MVCFSDIRRQWVLVLLLWVSCLSTAISPKISHGFGCHDPIHMDIGQLIFEKGEQIAVGYVMARKVPVMDQL